MAYSHKLSPEGMPDSFAIAPGQTREMPHTRTNPKEFELEVWGSPYLRLGKFKISAEDKWLVFKEVEPGKMRILLQDETVLGEVNFK
jgi:hypothetical protein